MKSGSECLSRLCDEGLSRRTLLSDNGSNGSGSHLLWDSPARLNEEAGEQINADRYGCICISPSLQQLLERKFSLLTPLSLAQEHECSKAKAWSDMMGELKEIHNQAVDKVLALRAKADAKAKNPNYMLELGVARADLAFLLKMANLPASASEAVRSGRNPLFVLHQTLVVEQMALAMQKRWRDLNDVANGDLLILMRHDRETPLVYADEFKRWIANVDLYLPLVYTPITRGFAYAVPNANALRCISQYSPVVEMGAGSGYWAYHLIAAGCDVISYDITPTADQLTKESGHPRFCEQFTEIKHGGAKQLIRHVDCTLLLVWPCSSSTSDGPWDADCLDAFQGSHVIYVGEWEGQTCTQLGAGSTSSAQFQNRLREEFECVERIEIPRWPHMMDDLSVWKRRCTVCCS